MGSLIAWKGEFVALYNDSEGGFPLVVTTAHFKHAIRPLTPAGC